MPTRPCSKCPFTDRSRPGATGGSDPRVFIGQAMGPFMLSCHQDPVYQRNKWDPEARPCAGAAIYRANVGAAARMPPAILALPQDPALAFPTAEALLAHHTGLSLDEAREELQERTPYDLFQEQRDRATTRLIPIRRRA